MLKIQSQSQVIRNEDRNIEMEDYLYEKKKKFEMMKNRQKMKKANNTGNTNDSANDIKLQTRQCEKNILKKYDFKTKKANLTPIKQKVMLKKRQSTEKNLLLNLDVLNDDYCTNTICLQEDEFTLNEEDTEANVEATNTKNIYNDFSVQRSMTNNLLSGDFDDIIISKRESSLSFHNPSLYGSSSIEIVSINDNASTSNSIFNRRQSSNFTVGGPNPNHEKLQKRGSIYSFFQKQSSSFFRRPSTLLKKVKSFIQNSTNDEIEVSSGLENNSLQKNWSFSSSTTDSASMESKKKSKSKSKLNNTKGSSDNLSSRPKRTFSLSSFKFKSSKSITSINNNNNSGAGDNDTEFSNKSQIKYRNSISRGLMKRISLSKLKFGSSKNIEVKLVSRNSELHDSDITLNNDKKNIDEDRDSPKLQSSFSQSYLELNKKNFDRLCSILFYVEPNDLVNYFEKARGDEDMAISLYMEEHINKLGGDHQKDIHYLKASDNLNKPSAIQQ